MGFRITRADEAPHYSPPLHSDVTAQRLQGLEAGETENFWVSMSVFPPGATAQPAPAPQEIVYVVVDGELAFTINESDSQEHYELSSGDSVHFSTGTVRAIENRSSSPARLFVVGAIAKD